MKKVLYLFLFLLVACQGNIVDTEILTPEKKDQLIDTKKENMAVVPINGPADFQNISNILGVPVTYDEMALCTHVNINKWARYKPVRYPNVVERLTDVQFQAARGGLNFIEFNTAADLITHYRNNPTYTFEYLKPRGSSVSPVEPYRIHDFMGYSSDAIRWYIVGGKRDIYFSSDPVAQLFLQTEGVNIDQNLSWSTVNMLDHYYGALIVPKSSIYNISIGLSDVPFSNTSVSSYIGDVPIQGLTDGTYEVYSFIYRKIAGSPPVIKYIPIESGYMGEATIQASRLTITGSGMVSPDNLYYKAEWTLQFKNYDNSDVIVNNVVVSVRYRNSTPWSTLQSGEVSSNLGNIQVNALQTVTRTGVFNNCLQNIVSQGNGAYLQVDNSSDPALRQIIPINGPY